jgi:hypothetical protein
MSTLEGTYYSIHQDDGNKTVQIELPFTLYNKGMGVLNSHELHLEID